MKGKYEIKSKSTGKVVYESQAEDIALDWNTKKRLFLIGRFADKKLSQHVEKYGVGDLYFQEVVKEDKAEIIESPVGNTKKRTTKKK